MLRLIVAFQSDLMTDALCLLSLRAAWWTKQWAEAEEESSPDTLWRRPGQCLQPGSPNLNANSLQCCFKGLELSLTCFLGIRGAVWRQKMSILGCYCWIQTSTTMAGRFLTLNWKAKTSNRQFQTHKQGFDSLTLGFSTAVRPPVNLSFPLITGLWRPATASLVLS